MYEHTFIRIQTCVFNIQRSDYMIDKKPGAGPVLKQIEINTIAAGCFALTQDRLENLFRYNNYVLKSYARCNLLV